MTRWLLESQAVSFEVIALHRIVFFLSPLKEVMRHNPNRTGRGEGGGRTCELFISITFKSLLLMKFNEVIGELKPEAYDLIQA